ncbi:hypothetical protein MRB53_039341 [Persea americana]|nr:hypothetical protein MRB53_039341 [Persea americana]
MSSPMQSPRVGAPKRRSLRSEAAPWTPTPSTTGGTSRYSAALSRRSSQSSIRTVATSHSNFSSATSFSVCSTKFDRAFASQTHLWSTSSPAISRHPSISSQSSLLSLQTLPAHILGKRQNLHNQLRAVEQVIREHPDLKVDETGSLGWLLAHERYLIQSAIKYDERALSEWEAAQDWNISAHESPVSKIFVTQPSRFGLTPEEHKRRVGQARQLTNNAIDLWRFSDERYQDAFQLRGIRERLQAETVETAGSTSHESEVRPKSGKKDYKTWLKEVSRTAEDGVQVKDDGRVMRVGGTSDGDGKCCSHHASTASQSLEEVDFLSSQSLHKAVIDGDIRRIKRILTSHPEKVNHLDSAGYTALLYARTKDVASILIEHGADLQAVTPAGRRSLLHKSVATGNHELVEFLQSRGMKDTLDIDGHYASPSSMQ